MPSVRISCIGFAFASTAFIPAASASCAVFGDSIGLGLGHALNGACPTWAQIGILSSVVAAKVTPGDRWAVVSLGSNDFPTGLTPEMKMRSAARVNKALFDVYGKVGKHLILIVPANEARPIVRAWADTHGVPAIDFEPGQDGVHPRKASYEAMAQEIKSRIDK